MNTNAIGKNRKYTQLRHWHIERLHHLVRSWLVSEAGELNVNTRSLSAIDSCVIDAVEELVAKTHALTATGHDVAICLAHAVGRKRR